VKIAIFVRAMSNVGLRSCRVDTSLKTGLPHLKLTRWFDRGGIPRENLVSSCEMHANRVCAARKGCCRSVQVDRDWDGSSGRRFCRACFMG